MPPFNTSNVQQLSAVSPQATQLIGQGNPLQAGREQVAGQKAMQDERLAAMKEEADKNKAHEQLLQSSQQQHSAAQAAQAELGTQKRHAATIGLQQDRLQEEKFNADRERHKRDVSEGLARQQEAVQRKKDELQEYLVQNVNPIEEANLLQQLRAEEDKSIDLQTRMAMIHQLEGRTKQEQIELLNSLEDAHVTLRERVKDQMNSGGEAGTATVQGLSTTAENMIRTGSTSGFIGAGGFSGAAAGAAEMINKVIGLVGWEIPVDAVATEQQLIKLAAEIGMDVEGSVLMKPMGSTANEILMDPGFRTALGRHMGRGMATDLAGKIAGASGGKIDATRLAPVLSDVIAIAMGQKMVDANGNPVTLAQQMEVVQNVGGASKMVIEGAIAAVATQVGELGRGLSSTALEALGGESEREAGGRAWFGLVEGPEGGLNQLGYRRLLGDAFNELSTGLMSMSVHTRAREAHLAEGEEVINNMRTWAMDERSEHLDQLITKIEAKNPNWSGGLSYKGQSYLRDDHDQYVEDWLMNQYEDLAGAGSGYDIREEFEDQHQLADALQGQLGISGQGLEGRQEALSQESIDQTTLRAQSELDLGRFALDSPESMAAIKQAGLLDQGARGLRTDITNAQSAMDRLLRESKKKYKWKRR